MANIIQGRATQDSALSYFVNQLTALDKQLYEPLFNVTYGRDITLRSDVSFANRATSYMRTNFAGSGSISTGVETSSGTGIGGGIPWFGMGASGIQGVEINGDMVTTPLRRAAVMLSYDEDELNASSLLGQSLDKTKFDALNMKYQLSVDQMAYVGDTDVTTGGGLLNKAGVPISTSAYKIDESSTPTQILDVINSALTLAWKNSGQTICPSDIGVPADQFAYMASNLVSSAGTQSILSFIQQYSIATAKNGKPVNIVPMKWATGRGVDGANRMVVYTNKNTFIRLPLVPIQAATAYYKDLTFNRPYKFALGEVENPYPETVLYVDGI